MTAHTLFSLSQVAPLPFWLLLLALPHRRGTQLASAAFLVAFAAAYGVTLFLAPQGGGTFEAFRTFLGSEWGAVTLWLHALSLDFLAGCWIAWDARRLGVSRWLAAPMLVLTLFFGPIGVLGWLVLRLAMRRVVAVYET